MKPIRYSTLQLVLLAVGVFLLPSCATTINSHLRVSTSYLIYSRMVNRRPAGSGSDLLRAYWQVVCDAQRHIESEYKQTQQFSGLYDSSRAGFRCGTVEVDYEISKTGVMSIQSVRCSEGLRNAQATFARRAMKEAAGSLKPFPPEVVSVAGEAIQDTMIFEFR
jgi:hypothetical protein